MKKSLDKNMPLDVLFEEAIVVGNLAMFAYAEKYGLELPNTISIREAEF